MFLERARCLVLSVVCLLLCTASFAQQTPWSGSPVSLPGLLQAEAYDRGGEGVAWHDLTPGNAFGPVFRTDDMDVGAIPGNGGHHIGALDPGEWAEYTVNVATTGSYTATLRYASAALDTVTFRLLLDGVDVSGSQTLAATGNWQQYQIKTFPVSLTAGVRVLRVSFDAGAFNFDSLDFALVQQTPWSGSPVLLPGLLEAEAYDRGGEGVAWHDMTPGNAFGPVFRSDDMDVGAIPNGGGYHIGGLDPGEWAEYTVNVATTGDYTVNLRYASAALDTVTFRLLLDGIDVSGPQTLTATGNWQQYQIRSIPVTLTAGGDRVLRVSFDAGAFNFDSLDFVLVQQTPWSGSPVSLPGVLEAEAYDRGGEGVAWHDTTPGNAFGPFFRYDDMDVGPIPSGGYHIGALEAGEWAEYTVNVAATATYTVKLRYATAYSSATFRLLLDDIDVSGPQSVPFTGDWQQYQIKSFSVPLTAGSNRVLRVSFEAGWFNFDSLELALCTAPQITGNPVPPPDPGETEEPFDPVLEPIVLESQATGTGLTFQWYKDGALVENNEHFQGADTSRLTLAQPDQSIHGGIYTLRAANDCGSAQTAPIQVNTVCGAPSSMLTNIHRAFTGGADACPWVGHLRMNFADISLHPDNSWGLGRSYNWPVLAAAIAYVRTPDQMRRWWSKYLKNEIGEEWDASDDPHHNPPAQPVWYYGGQELASSVYQEFNIACVLAVRYKAAQEEDWALSELAGRWLRATFALHALSATNVKPVRQFAVDREPGTGPICCGKRECTQCRYNGPFLVLAGMRSPWDRWLEPDRSRYFSAAIGWTTNNSNLEPGHALIRGVVEAMADDADGRDAYGLSTSEKNQLTQLMLNGTIPDGFVDNFLGRSLRTQVPYHVLAWNGGKASLMEENTHGQTAPTYGVVYENDGDAYFLYPWEGVFVGSDRFYTRGITHGRATLNLTGPSPYMEARNDISQNNPPTHPVARTVRTPAGLLPPQTELRYWLKLTPDAEPNLCTSFPCNASTVIKPIRAAAADFDGDGKSDIVLHKDGAWHRYTSTAYLGGVWTGAAPGCIPAPADYDGDRRTDYSLYCNGAWHFYDDKGNHLKGIWTGGHAGALPVPADYDGDLDADVVVYHAGAWHFYDYATGAYLKGLWTGPGPGTVPLPMDHNGDGRADFSVYHDGAWHFYNDDGSYRKGIWTGGAGDVPVPGDYDGDNDEEPVIFRGGAWLFFDFASGANTHGIWTGANPPFQPAPLDVDGDGKLDFSVYEPGGAWHFFHGNGSYRYGVWTGTNSAGQPISRRQLAQ